MELSTKRPKERKSWRIFFDVDNIFVFSGLLLPPHFTPAFDVRPTKITFPNFADGKFN